LYSCVSNLSFAILLLVG